MIGGPPSAANVRTVAGVDDTRHDQAARARGREVRAERSDVSGLEQVPFRIARRPWIAHAQLVHVDERGIGTRATEPFVDLPRHGGLADPGRTTQPQNRNHAP